MWWVLASSGQLSGVVNSVGDYVNIQGNMAARILEVWVFHLFVNFD
jgi:hypothetical protein